MIILAGLIAGVVLGVITYRTIVRRVPIRLMAGAEQRLAALRGTGRNHFHHGRTPTHQSRQIVMPSPDLVYSSCVYDLSLGPLHLFGTLPPADHYWSLSIYAHNTDNFFVLNDRQLPGRQFDVVLRQAGQTFSMPGSTIVDSPTTTGIALIRMIQRRPDDLAIIKASHNTTRCEVMAG